MPRDMYDRSKAKQSVNVPQHPSASSAESKKQGGGGSDDADAVFYVEKILQKRPAGKGFKYLVKWKGYGDEFNTWEKGSNFASRKLIL